MNGEEDYFRLIEEYFLQRRGNPVLLNPKEWALIREWYEKNIPQEVILRAIDRGFEKKEDDDKTSLSLRYFKRLVKSEHKRYLKSMEGKIPIQVETAPDTRSVQEFLTLLLDTLHNSSDKARTEGKFSLADFLLLKREQLENEIFIPFQGESSPNLQRVEHQLTIMEKEIEQVLMQMISEEQIKLFKEDAMRELKIFEEKLEWPVYQEMIRRSLIKSIRKQYNIPRLSLFYM